MWPKLYSDTNLRERLEFLIRTRRIKRIYLPANHAIYYLANEMGQILISAIFDASERISKMS